MVVLPVTIWQQELIHAILPSPLSSIWSYSPNKGEFQTLFGNWPKLTIGRIQSIPIRLDATFVLVLIFGLIGIPIQTLGQFWFVAAGVIGIFFSILLHELGHALMAKRYGVGVVEVVIGGFYGYARLRSQGVPHTVMIRIIAAGPLVNLVIFVTLWLVLSLPGFAGLVPQKLVTRTGTITDWQTTTLQLLVVFNLVMFVFNFLPAFPLDGGRILVLVLDGKLPRQVSVIIVSALGLVLGSLMILYGMKASVILSLIGLMILLTNFRRLHRVLRQN